MFSLVFQFSAEGLGLQCITQLISQTHYSYQLNKYYEHSLTEAWIPSHSHHQLLPSLAGGQNWAFMLNPF